MTPVKELVSRLTVAWRWRWKDQLETDGWCLSETDPRIDATPTRMERFDIVEQLVPAIALTDMEQRALVAEENCRKLLAAGREDLVLMTETAATVTSLRHRAENAEAQVVELRKALEEKQAELVATREVCSLVRRQDYFDVPTPVLVEAQIEAARWAAYDDFARVAEFQKPPIDGVLKRYRTALQHRGTP